MSKKARDRVGEVIASHMLNEHGIAIDMTSSDIVVESNKDSIISTISKKNLVTPTIAKPTYTKPNYGIFKFVWMFIFVYLGIILLGNTAIGAVYSGQIYPGVKVAGKDLGGMTRDQALKYLNNQSIQVKLNIKVGDQNYQVDNNELGLKYDIPATVQKAYLVGRKDKGPIANVLGMISARSNDNVDYSYSFDSEKLTSFTQKISDGIKKPAKDASLSIEDGVVVTSEDVSGEDLISEDVAESIKSALISTTPTLGATNRVDLTLHTTQADAKIQVQDLAPASALANQYLNSSVILNFNQKRSSVSRNEIGQWISFVSTGDNYQAIIDPEKVRSWTSEFTINNTVDPINKKIEISGSNQTVKQEGQNGVMPDQENLIAVLIKEFENNPQTNINYNVPTITINYQTVYNEVATIENGTFIEVNLSTQSLNVFEKGNIIYSSPVTSGATGQGFGTPAGIFSIYYKNTNTYLDGSQYGWSYRVHVDYWMPFNGGVGFHDAAWRSNFGGSDYYYGGSHGCVNLPSATAAFIYNWAPVGTTVWVHY